LVYTHNWGNLYKNAYIFMMSLYSSVHGTQWVKIDRTEYSWRMDNELDMNFENTRTLKLSADTTNSWTQSYSLCCCIDIVLCQIQIHATHKNIWLAYKISLFRARISMQINLCNSPNIQHKLLILWLTEKRTHFYQFVNSQNNLKLTARWWCRIELVSTCTWQ